ADAIAECMPVYEEMPGWSESTSGVTSYAELPESARNYLKRLEELTETPIDMISTGPDRVETIILKHPFD
ncbi:MAG: adenylosuccinate synthetase, partial [Gammaproteobacteria bacterium]|nr:adenylosuccinate synthetase [Gammaproteobacteria bacterium]